MRYVALRWTDWPMVPEPHLVVGKHHPEPALDLNGRAARNPSAFYPAA
jgi:hypothetical protein